MVFDSVEKAEKYLEPIDVRNNEYVIYDRDGRLIRGVVVKHLLAERVKLQAASEPGAASSELRRLLIRFLKDVEHHQDRALEKCSLDELLEMALRFKTE